ncbi:MAG TPA: prolyl oligopeptidase family serine peptidase, partial [Flavobacteriaceae bacterium]|nr:prolyl oligopeptidase family serine peptidase [Flavobacteriaceae bacterium]
GAYHSMLAFGKDNLWRYENYQMRMGFPFYENPQAYIENSPLYLSSEIQTPVMLWSGKNDSTVDPNQSIALFLALRRRAQKATLYLYHDEPHVLYKKENQIDLSRRIKSWMDYYLK